MSIALIRCGVRLQCTKVSLNGDPKTALTPGINMIQFSKMQHHSLRSFKLAHTCQNLPKIMFAVILVDK